MEPSNVSEWTQVKSRRSRKPKIYPVKNYWNGFEESGNERWYIELSDGRILTPRHEDYIRWSQKHFPNAGVWKI